MFAEIDYDSVIADLEAKRASFNAAIDAAIQGIAHDKRQLHFLRGSKTRHRGSSRSRMTTVKRQQTTREITDALEAANYHHQSANFLNTVNTALYRRERDEGDVVKIGRQWALAEWYPGRRHCFFLSNSL